jgi:hypothetical protein
MLATMKAYNILSQTTAKNTTNIANSELFTYSMHTVCNFILLLSGINK